MRRSGFTWIEAVVVLIIIGILAAILFPIFARSPRNAPRSACQSNLKQIGLGFLQYVQDYDDHLPLISAGEQGWAEEIQPYLKSWQIFQCPSAEKPTNPICSDYFLNARVAGLEQSKVPSISRTLLLGEGFDNGATNSHFSELPLNWRTDEKSPAKGHLDGANYAFADGHVKWFTPELVSTQPPQQSNVTFALR